MVIIMYSLKCSASFDSAHFLSGYDGKCANIHGHRWVIEAVFCGKELKKSGSQGGMLVDFSDIKYALREIAEEFDHSLIYEKGSLKESTVLALKDENFKMIQIDVRPTAENFARIIFDRLRNTELPVHSVTVYETPDNCAVYEEEDL